MKTHTTAVPLTTKFGKLYAAVATATENSYHEMGTGNVTETIPRLWVASDLDFTADPGAAEHWTIRGQAYGVHQHLCYRRGKWTRDPNTPYRGGFRDDAYNTVEFGTKTWDAMWDAVESAVGAFAFRYPKWPELSTFLLYRSQASGAEGQALAARREADKAEAQAAALRAQQAGTQAALTPDLRDLITPENA